VPARQYSFGHHNSFPIALRNALIDYGRKWIITCYKEGAYFLNLLIIDIQVLSLGMYL
jgi:hypothetical protein